MNRFVAADPAKCIGCRTCEIACAMAHKESDSPVLMTAELFNPRIKVVRTESVTTVVTCHHCEDAPCLRSCPEGAIFYREGTVQIDQSRCIGCKNCMMSCPFGVMEVIAKPATKTFAGVEIITGMKAQAHKCDLCVDRTNGPACVEACPTSALRVVDEASIAKAREELRVRTAIESVAV